ALMLAHMRRPHVVARRGPTRRANRATTRLAPTAGKCWPGNAGGLPRASRPLFLEAQRWRDARDPRGNAAETPAVPPPALLLLPRRQRRAARPGRDGLPAGIVLVGELPAARMECIATGFRGERMDQDLALERIVGRLHELHNGLVVLAGLLV